MPLNRNAYRELLMELAQKTQAKMPQLNGRVPKACKLVLAGDVTLLAGGKATVASMTDPGKTYTLEPGHCTCADFARVPEYLCAHRLAAGFARKLQEILPDKPVPTAAPRAAALPEAPASVNVKVLLAGHEVMVTLRDTSEDALFTRLQAVLRRSDVRPIVKSQPRRQWAQQRQGRAER